MARKRTRDEESRMKIILGTFVHATETSPMVVLKDTLIGVLHSKIEFVASLEELGPLQAKYGFQECSIQKLTSDQFMMPGLVDTHIHAPQFPNNGLAFDLPLLEWLHKYTYSIEAQFSDTSFAQEVYNKVVSHLVQPIITPRFAVNCPEEHMLQLGHLASKYKCHIQTHLSESSAEVRMVKEIFPSSKSYAHVYDSGKLLGNKTVLAHCVWLTDEEVDLLRERGCGVSHCPNSNLSLRSGICDVRKLLSRGLKVGLGSDCSGGYCPSLLDSIRYAVQSSNVLSLEMNPDYQRITPQDAFMMATLGGSKALNLGDRIGNFEVGKEFDALLVDVATHGTPVDTFTKNTIEDKIFKFLFLGDDRNIQRVYVSGRIVHSSRNGY